MAKFNSGYLRTVDVQKSFYETKNGEQIGMFPFEVNPPKPDSGTVSAPIGGTGPNVGGLTGTNVGLSGPNTNLTGLTVSNTGLTVSNTNTGSKTKATGKKKDKKK